MGLLLSSYSQAQRSGAYVILRTPAPMLQPQGTGIACLVGQFPWGPSQAIYKPTDTSDMILTFAPWGTDHTGDGWRSMLGKGFPQLWVVRVASATAAQATCTLATVAPVNIVTLTGKYPGAAGNSLTATVAVPGSDGNSNHFDLTVSLTGASGNSTEVYRNGNVSGVGTDYLWADIIGKSRLLASITKLAAGIPVAGTFTFAAGSDGGSLTSADFVGTQGASDKGLAKTEGVKGINHIFFSDMGNSLRAACNAGMLAHAEYTSDRMGYVNGNSGITAAAAQTDVANYRSRFLRYVDVWPYINDDLGNKVLASPSSFAASVASQSPPSRAISWKNSEVVSGMLSNVVDLEADRGVAAANNTAAGIVTFIREPNGGFSFEEDVTTLTPSDPTKKWSTDSQMAIYIGLAFTSSTRGSIDGPNVEYNQQPLVDALDRLLTGLKNNAKVDPNHLPYIKDFKMDDLPSFNAQTDIQNGQFVVPATVETGAPMGKLFLSLNLGTQTLVTT